MTTYTLGEVLRLGLLKNQHGEPYKHKATLSRIARDLGATKTPHAHGESYALTQAQIDLHNKKMQVFSRTLNV